MRFSAPEKESAVIGYLAISGLTSLPASCLPDPDDFTDPRWKPIYTIALNLHRSGRAVSYLAINDEIVRLKWDVVLDKEIGSAGWQTWLSQCDSSLSLVPTAVVDCLKEIRRLATERRGHEVIQKAANGKIGFEQALLELQAINEASQVSSLEVLLASRRFDTKNPPERAPAIFLMARQCIATPGNIQVIAAQAKAGKSALVGAFLASTLGLDGDTLGIDSANPHGHAAIHFDTEQSPADHHGLVVTALSRVNQTEAPEWLHSYRITDVPTSQRFELLEHVLRTSHQQCGGIHSVINDGIADFISDPNDPAEAFAAVERLHRLSVQFSTVIINVLHFNPGSESNKTRGHLGSQLERKAETNLALAKDEQGITTVYTTSARHAHIAKQDGPRFKWDSLAEMHVSCAPEREGRNSARKDAMSGLVEEIFNVPNYNGGLSWAEVHQRIEGLEGLKRTGARRRFDNIIKAGLMEKNGAGLYHRIK